MKEKNLEFSQTRFLDKIVEKDCFKCSQTIKVKWVIARKNYSQKNNWGYWTEKEENKEKYICSDCIRQWYYRNTTDFYQHVTNPKKLAILRTYLSPKDPF